MQTFENLLLQNYSTKFLDIAHKWSLLCMCNFKVCSNGGATYLISEMIAKDILNITNVMQSFENLHLQTALQKLLGYV